MNFDELIDFLEKRLKKEKPGASAHELMKPKMAHGASFQLKHNEQPKDGGVLILLFENNGFVHFPLIQRPTYQGIHSGQVALPGGKKEESDSDLFETALRETKEEIGVGGIEVIGSLTSFYVAASNYNVLPVIGIVREMPTFQPDPREVEGLITPTVNHIIDPKRRKEKEMTVRNGYKLLSPYFDLHGKVVWGATAMMLSELVEILKEFD